jgi:hypothetical protein
LNLGAATPTWSTTQVTAQPMHQGDICNLGIACPPIGSNRNLADFISETLDEKGCAHINFADDQTLNQVSSADQTGGTCLSHVPPFIAAGPSPTPVPLPNTSTAVPGPLPSPPPWLLLVLPVIAFLGIGGWRFSRVASRT